MLRPSQHTVPIMDNIKSISTVTMHNVVARCRKDPLDCDTCVKCQDLTIWERMISHCLRLSKSELHPKILIVAVLDLRFDLKTILKLVACTCIACQQASEITLPSTINIPSKCSKSPEDSGKQIMADPNLNIRPVVIETTYVHLAREHNHPWCCDLHCKVPIWEKKCEGLVCEPFPLLMVPSTDPRLLRSTAIPRVLTQTSRESPSGDLGKENFPKLEEMIPHNDLPIDLLVVAKVRCVQGVEGQGTTPDMAESARAVLSSSETRANWIDTPAHRYKRVLPVPEPIERASQVSTATLWLADHNLCGVGSHSSVHKAPFQLPKPFITNSRSLNGRVSVIAKLAFDNEYEDNESSDREHLENEAQIFNLLSSKHSHMQQDWQGRDRDRHKFDAIIPKFYGYYKPEDDNDEGTLSPILLMEDCGVRTDFAGLHDQERSAILSQFRRLHETGVIHHSAYPRNILCQPGPLSVKPSQRSLDYKVFRIIDFGRSEHMEGESMRLIKAQAIREELANLRLRLYDC